jgi:catechol 2,3-dioxygenase-like lactoylglutathione lyase family enzyme
VSEHDGPLGSVGLLAVTLYVSDLDAAVAWYFERLGLEPVSQGKDAHRFASFLVGGSIVVLEPVEAALDTKGPGSESTTLNVVTDRDPVEVRAELLSRGVNCGEVVASPNYSSFLMRDLDGNRFYVTRAVTDKAREAERTITEQQDRSPTS